MLFQDSKFETKLQSYKDSVMALLIARRMHWFANSKKPSSEYSKLGIRFITTETGGGKTDLYVSSTKLRALDEKTVHVFKQLAKTYESILKPFFSKR